MKALFFLFFVLGVAHAAPKAETFVVTIQDRSMSVIAPDKRKDLFSVLIENRSLSDQVGKFIVGGKNLKFVSVKSGQTESVEIENKTSANIIFIPISPAFQEVDLIFGKKVYEIPSKE